MEEQKKFGSESMDLEKLLEQKARLEGIIRNKFMKVVTVMFTDMKGSTAIAENQGDLASRMLIKDHNDIVFPRIKENGGVLVKTMGDGTLSYFESAQDALKAAVAIQREIKAFNLKKVHKIPILVRAGMHTGMAIIEKNDIFGDVVNTASRFESISSAGEICLSEATYEALSDKEEIPCRFHKETSLKGKEGTFKVYKAFWDPSEAVSGAAPAEEAPATIKMGKTVAVESRPAESPPAPGQPAQSPEEKLVLQRADILFNENELLELLSLCEENSSFGSVMQIQGELIARLKAECPVETMLYGEEALWFFKTAMTTGRLREADFPLTNLAVSRAPIVLSVRGGEGFMRVPPKGTESVKLVRVDTGSARDTVMANTEHNLGKAGSIVFSNCFPAEYKVHRDRFLVLKLTAEGDCVKRLLGRSLGEVWPNYEKESRKLIILGI